MKVALGADHAGFHLKEHLRSFLAEAGHTIQDFGAHSLESVDYPDLAAVVAHAVAEGRFEAGILVCGSGTGMAIAANKVPGIRAAACFDVTSARLARAHNNANVLALGERLLGSAVAEDVAAAFLSTSFDGGRHERRLAKITALESSTPT
ncbi:MAG TPA: ribose 5-phosphate isomerase B [Thermoanaerobaculia bacterium]|nr:ribose 5-phosphate isomerase B [Thermoanaerobaculia bacterium]